MSSQLRTRMTQIMDPDVAQDYDTSILPEVVSFARLCGGRARTSSTQDAKDLHGGVCTLVR